jgi:hypothetical protein
LVIRSVAVGSGPSEPCGGFRGWHILGPR